MISGAEEHFRTTYKTAFYSTPRFAEHPSRTAAKEKHETAIYNSVKWCFSHEKMQLLLNLSTKFLFHNKIINLTGILIKRTYFSCKIRKIVKS